MLGWQFDGTPVPAAEVKGLSVTVVSAEVVAPASEAEFPTLRAFETLEGVTKGKPGGC